MKEANAEGVAGKNKELEKDTWKIQPCRFASASAPCRSLIHQGATGNGFAPGQGSVGGIILDTRHSRGQSQPFWLTNYHQPITQAEDEIFFIIRCTGHISTHTSLVHSPHHEDQRNLWLRFSLFQVDLQMLNGWEQSWKWNKFLLDEKTFLGVFEKVWKSKYQEPKLLRCRWGGCPSHEGFGGQARLYLICPRPLPEPEALARWWG